MAAANNEFFAALSMLEHERGITAEYLIEKIKAAIIIAVKKNYEVEEDHVKVDIDPAAGRFDVALIQDIVADEDWYDEHSEIGITEAQKIRKTYEVGDRIITPLKTQDFGRIAAQTAKHVIRQGIREAERSQQLSEIQSRAHDIVQATVTRVDPEKGIVALDLGKGGEAITKPCSCALTGEKGGHTMRKKYNTPHRSRVVKTRLSEDEYADFTARLAPYGISQSEFLRQAIRRATIRPVVHVSSVNDELLSAVGKLTAEYGRIGGNLNQIARFLNEYGTPYNALSVEVRAAISDLAALKFEVLRKVGDAVGNIQAYQL